MEEFAQDQIEKEMKRLNSGVAGGDGPDIDDQDEEELDISYSDKEESDEEIVDDEEEASDE